MERIVPDRWAFWKRNHAALYSATDKFIDGDIPYNPHSSYVIYRSDGKFLRNVDNHISPNDEIPSL
jgi:adenine specific DNA methylase Mod